VSRHLITSTPLSSRGLACADTSIVSVPPLTGVAADIYGTGLAMFVPMCFFVGSLTYAFAVNFVPYYTRTMDALTDTQIGLQGHTHTTDEETRGSDLQEKNAVIIERVE